MSATLIDFPARTAPAPLPDYATRYEPFDPEDRYRVRIAGRGAGTVLGVYCTADVVTEHLVRLDSGDDVRVLTGRLRVIAETEIPAPPIPVLTAAETARIGTVRAEARGVGLAALRRVAARVADAWGRRVLRGVRL